MFFPESMLRVEIIIPKEHLYKELEAIGKAGLLHIDKSKGRSFSYELQNRVNKLLGVVEGYLKFLGFQSEIKKYPHMEEEFGKNLSETEKRVSIIAPKIEELSNAFKKVEKEEKMIESAREFAQSLKNDIDVEKIARSLEFIGFKSIVLPSENIETFILALKRYDPFVVYNSLSSGTKAVALFYDISDENHVINALTKLEGNEIPKDYFLKEKIEEIKSRREKIESDLEKIKKLHGEELLGIYANLKLMLKIFSARGALQKSGENYLLYGWVPKKQANKFERALRYAQVIFSKPGEDTPVLLKTPKILKPFETLIKNFSYPRYQEINPTVPFAAAFLIMFGVMFGDIGHGLVLMLAGFFVSKKFPKYEDLGKIYILAGASSVIFGFMYGSVFGFHDIVPHILFNPVENVDMIIYSGIAIGVFFITLSFILNIISLARRKKLSALIMGEGGVLWLLIYWFAIGIAVKAVILEMPVKYELYILGVLLGFLFIVLFMKRKEFAQSLLDTIMQMFEHAVNTISFIRLGAFALAHGALFLALFSIADIVSKTQAGGITYWFIILLGNCFIIVLEGVVVTIQTLRLEYYEFFKRFFKGGGEPYEPFVLESEK
ncbi:V-type ATP synthase subunit I [Nitrosophilus alvini]|uniref:V-type ATP synthase subunit I n=1 Tax=Nitrosophilus alvini TaxID=2714855 RepID=UPI00190BC8BD|nr:V-type ATPase 116kDa subunit family protein [Nitrosophilus alvini]